MDNKPLNKTGKAPYSGIQEAFLGHDSLTPKVDI